MICNIKCCIYFSHITLLNNFCQLFLLIFDASSLTCIQFCFHKRILTNCRSLLSLMFLTAPQARKFCCQQTSLKLTTANVFKTSWDLTRLLAHDELLGNSSQYMLTRGFVAPFIIYNRILIGKCSIDVLWLVNMLYKLFHTYKFLLDSPLL